MKKILVCTDFSPESKKALAFSRSLVEGRDAELILFAVVEDLQPTSVTFEFGIAPIDTAGVMARAVTRANEELLKLQRQEFPGLRCTTAVVEGYRPVNREITEFAREQGAQAIVLATHGRTGIAHALLGSVAERVVRGAPCPVFVIPAAEEAPAELKGNLIVLSDLSDESLKIFPYAAKIGPLLLERGGQINLLHIVEDLVAGTFDYSIGVGADKIWAEQEERAGTKLERIRDQHLPGLRVTTTVIRQEHSVAEDVVRFSSARDAGLIILGTHGRGGINRLIAGSVAEQTIRLSRCPVLVVPITAPH